MRQIYYFLYFLEMVKIIIRKKLYATSHKKKQDIVNFSRCIVKTRNKMKLKRLKTKKNMKSKMKHYFDDMIYDTINIIQ